MGKAILTSGFEPPGTSDNDLEEVLSLLQNCRPLGRQKPFAVFCSKLRGLKIKKAAGKGQLKILRFGDVGALGGAEEPPVLLVRRCYERLEAEIDTQRTAIVGTPGIGKSMFMAFCLWRLAQEKNVAVLCQLGGDYVAIVWRNAINELHVWDLEEYDAKRLARIETCWFLADLQGKHSRILGEHDGVGELARARMIVFTSPEVQKYRAAVTKKHGVVLYMSPWTEEELRNYSRVCGFHFYLGNGTSEGDGTSEVDACVSQRYSTYGGVPRIVFARTKKRFLTLRREFKSAVEQASNDLDRFNAIWSAEETSPFTDLRDVSDKVLHMTALEGEAYLDFKRDFCSEQVKKHVVNRYLESSRQGVVDFVLKPCEGAGRRAWQGHLFESLVHEQFSEKYHLSIFDFRCLEELEGLSEKLYYKPQSKNFGAIDAFHMWTEGGQTARVVLEMLQITVAEKHDIRAAHLGQVVEVLNKKHSECEQVLQFTFVVPEYSKLESTQPFKDSKGHVVAMEHPFDKMPQLCRKVSHIKFEVKMSDATVLRAERVRGGRVRRVTEIYQRPSPVKKRRRKI